MAYTCNFITHNFHVKKKKCSPPNRFKLYHTLKHIHMQYFLICKQSSFFECFSQSIRISSKFLLALFWRLGSNGFFEQSYFLATHDGVTGQSSPCKCTPSTIFTPVAYPGILFRGGGVQQIQLRTEDRQNGDLGGRSPQSGVPEAAVIWYKKFYFI